jgi:hypothetical protein
METSFSTSAQRGGDGDFNGVISRTGRRSNRAEGASLSSQGSQADVGFFAPGLAGYAAADKVKASG